MLVGGYQPIFRLVHVLLNAQEFEDVRMAHARQLVDIVLRGPRFFFLHAKDLDGHILIVELGLPHITESTTGLLFQQLNGTVAEQWR